VGRDLGRASLGAVTPVGWHSMTDLYELLDTIRRVVPAPEGHELAEMLLHYAKGLELTTAERDQLRAWRDDALMP
jgi:hypothetical protein